MCTARKAFGKVVRRKRQHLRRSPLTNALVAPPTSLTPARPCESTKSPRLELCQQRTPSASSRSARRFQPPTLPAHIRSPTSFALPRSLSPEVPSARSLRPTLPPCSTLLPSPAQE